MQTNPLLSWFIVSSALTVLVPACDEPPVEEGFSDLEDLEDRHTSYSFAFIRTHQPAWDLCMDVEGFGTAPGTLVNQYPCKSMTQSHYPQDINQRFFLTPIPGSSETFQILSPMKIIDKEQEVRNCVDLLTPDLNGGNDDELNTSELQHGSHGLVMDRCDASDTRQHWTLIEVASEEPIPFAEVWGGDFETGEYHTYGRIQNVYTGECIDVPFGVDYKTALQVHPCHTGKNQQWDIFQPLWFG